MKELSKENKLKLLEASKKYFIEHSSYCICIAISGVIYRDKIDVGMPITHLDLMNVKKYLPEFTITNAKRLSIKYDFQKPTGISNYYWWNLGNNIPRLAFIDALIKEIEDKD